MIVTFDCNGFRVSADYCPGDAALDEEPELDRLHASDGHAELKGPAVLEAFGEARLLMLARRAYGIERMKEAIE